MAADVPATPLTLKQSFMVVPAQHKLSALFSFLRAHNLKKILVFVSSCKQARFLYETFRLLKPGEQGLSCCVSWSVAVFSVFFYVVTHAAST